MIEDHKPFTDWFNERPRQIQELMVRFPPDCIVRAKPGIRLVIPAPGERGTVVSWFEDGSVGVGDPNGLVRAACDPDDLETIAYAKLPDGRALDGPFIAGLIR